MNIVDIYGRLLGYNLLTSPQGGVCKHFSDIQSSTNFSNHDVPLPIIAAIALNSTGSRCTDLMNVQQAQLEFTPFEFGSWDGNVKTFTQTRYLGTHLDAGKPTSGCTTGFDNVGLIQATSGNVLPAAICDLSNQLPFDIGNDALKVVRALQQLLLKIKGPPDAADVAGASYPNPFYNHPSVVPAYSSSNQIYLIDSGFTGHNNPIWHHLHRNVSTLLVADAFNNISSLYATYVAARGAGLFRMPAIPSRSEYDNSASLRFFGCHQPSTMTIVWLPNSDHVYANNITGGELQLNAEQIKGTIANGRAAATGYGADSWGVCVACAVLGKTGEKLPEACQGCLQRYCWN